jgi:hypothetical protein
VEIVPAILLAAGGLYILSKVSAAATVSSLNFIITGYSFNSNGLYPTINVNVTAQNVTNQAVQFNALAANAYLNGALIGNVSGFQPVLINALSQTVIPLTILVNVTGVVSDVVAIFSGSAGSSALIELKGNGNIANTVVPFDVTYQPF